MPWTETTRPHDARRGRRYTSDLTDAEWALVAGFLPPPKQTGRPRTTELRDVLDAILSMAAMGHAAEGPPAALDRSALLL